MNDGYIEYGLKMDCEANGCVEKFGHLHSDTDRVMTGYWDGRFGPVLDPGDLPDMVNNHKTKVVKRRIGPWEDKGEVV